MRTWFSYALGAVLLLTGVPAVGAPGATNTFAADRAAMVDLIRDDVASTSRYIGTGELDERVMKAIATVPRHEFVPPVQLANAYENRPLPIGHGQTISQPYIVALMTHLAAVGADDRVLEIGTGSGYQAAVLAELVDHVYTMEIIEPLATTARERLARLGFDNVTVRFGDGYHGWEAHAPYDAIVVTAAADHVPPSLVVQLKPGGRIIIPVGSRFAVQDLVLIEKSEEGDLSTRQIIPVRFVPLTGGP